MGNVEIEVWGMALVDALVDEEGFAALCTLNQHLFPWDSQCNCHALSLQQSAHQRPLLILLESEGLDLHVRHLP